MNLLIESNNCWFTPKSYHPFFSYVRGQNPLHILAQYAKDNAVAIFDLFRQSMPEYPINALDADENIGRLTLNESVNLWLCSIVSESCFTCIVV